MKEFRTKNGTSLPLTSLKGKDYLLVAHRLVWFREDHPDWGLVTELIKCDDETCVAKATVYGVPKSPGEMPPLVATAHKREDRKHFADFIEKAETGAIGRALALCGYGTQFAPEIDEEDRIVDSPITPAIAKSGALVEQVRPKPTLIANTLPTPSHEWSHPPKEWFPDSKHSPAVHEQAKLDLRENGVAVSIPVYSKEWPGFQEVNELALERLKEHAAKCEWTFSEVREYLTRAFDVKRVSQLSVTQLESLWKVINLYRPDYALELLLNQNKEEEERTK